MNQLKASKAKNDFETSSKGEYSQLSNFQNVNEDEYEEIKINNDI